MQAYLRQSLLPQIRTTASFLIFSFRSSLAVILSEHQSIQNLDPPPPLHHILLALLSLFISCNLQGLLHLTMNTLARPGELQSTLPAKLLPGRPSLTQKRIHVEEVDSSRLAKKPKVSFSSDVEIRILDAWEKSPKSIQEEVGRALEKHARGDTSSYLEVKDIYSSNKSAENEPSTAILRNYTAALIGNVSLLNKSCSDLVYAILNSSWLARSDEYATLYTRFLANLVSAQGGYLADALRMLVENLTASKSWSAEAQRQFFKTARRSAITWLIWKAGRGFTFTNSRSGAPSPSIYLAADSFSKPPTFKHTCRDVSPRDRFKAVTCGLC